MQQSNETGDEEDCFPNTNKEKLPVKESCNNKAKNSWYHIDFFMVPVKFSYFFYTAKDCYDSYMIIFLLSIGLHVSQAGVINALREASFIVLATFWGMLADKYNRHKLVVMFLCVTSAILFSLFPLLSLTYTHEVNRIYEAHNQSLCIDNRNESYCHHNETAPNVNHNKTTNFQDQNKLFYVILGGSMFISIFDGPIVNFIDTMAIRKCELNIRKSDIGRQRVFRAIGVPFGVFLTESMIQVFPRSLKITPLTGIFASYVILMIPLTISLYFVSRDINFTQTQQIENFNKSDGEIKITHILWAVLRNKEMIMHLCTAFILATTLNLYITFLFLTMKTLKASSTLMTVFTAIASASAIFTLHFAEKITRMFGGTRRTIIVSVLLQTIRFILVSFTTNPIYLSLTQVLQSSFALGEYAITIEIARHTPAYVLTTIYSIVNSIFGISFITTNLAGGFVYERYGQQIFYLCASCIIGVWCVVLIINYTLTDCVVSNKSTERTYDNTNILDLIDPIKKS